MHARVCCTVELKSSYFSVARYVTINIKTKILLSAWLTVMCLRRILVNVVADKVHNSTKYNAVTWKMANNSVEPEVLIKQYLHSILDISGDKYHTLSRIEFTNL